MAAVQAGVKSRREVRLTLGTLALRLFLIAWLSLGLLFPIVQYMNAVLKHIVPLLAEPHIVSGMVKPHRVFFGRMTTHNPPHLLDVGGERLGERSSRHADHYVRHIKPLGQDVCSYQAVDGGVGLGEVFNHILLELIVISVADADEVKPCLGKLLG